MFLVNSLKEHFVLDNRAILVLNAFMSNQAGKGDAPRNCFSQEFRDNHDDIDWSEGERSELSKIMDEASDRREELIIEAAKKWEQ
tara:strand:+ start:304 stop:558 length:255 start_codon:yes stop_codon:yes gene_type:complete